MIMTNKNLEGRNMQTIIVLLNPGMLENADLDLRYRIPDRIEEVSNSLIQSNGYDYIDTEDGDRTGKQPEGTRRSRQKGSPA